MNGTDQSERGYAASKLAEQAALDLGKYGQVQWLGDSLTQSLSADAILKSVPADFDATDELLRFFSGDQWDGRVRDQRLAEHRPCLVINKLPLLYASAVNGASPLAPDECRRLKCWIAHRSRDAQMMYNFMASHLVEMAQLERKSKDVKIMSGDLLGRAVYEAYHRGARTPWERLPEPEKVNWKCAGEAAVKAYLNAEPLQPETNRT